MAKTLVEKYDLDYKRDADDREFLQFQTAAFNRIVCHYEKLAQDPEAKWKLEDAIFAAEVLLKAKDSYDIWKTTRGNLYRNRAVEFLLNVGTMWARQVLQRRGLL